MRLVPITVIMAILLATCPQALAQSRARIFDVPLGAPVSALPANEWVEPSCGTDGGPPSLRLDGFEEFGRCAVEDQTGLHEVWFIYDDEWEYVARAYRDPGEIGRFSANKFFGQPIISSVLIDTDGIIQGYRVVTDPRAPSALRSDAYLLLTAFKSLFGEAEWSCALLPLVGREEPVDGRFVKEDCHSVSDGRYIRIVARHLRKPGQEIFQVAPEGYFESSARLEVYVLSAVRGAPCCPASVLP